MLSNNSNIYWFDDDDEIYILGKEEKNSKSSPSEGNDNTFVNLFTNEIISEKTNNMISKVMLSYNNIYSITNYDNLIDLDDITKPSIFTTLKMRFIENKEYTYIGNDMVFINSYNNNMNDMNELENYIDYFKSDNNNNKLPIDVWNLANSVYNELNKTSTNQSIIFCGESGSGKTKCMQKCIELYSQYNFTSSKTSQSTLKYKQKLNSINSILESFGHSKTIHNKSSSCFIKYFEFNYSLDDKLILQNVKLKPILSSLDLSRISYLNPNEGNYNIFYQLCAAQYKDLKSFDAYRYLNNCKLDSLPSLSNLQSALECFDLTVEEIDSIFSILAGILMLGNIKFEEVEDHVRVINSDFLNDTASMLGFAASNLNDFLTISNFMVNGIDIQSTSTAHSYAVRRLDMLSKVLFSNVFSHIVRKINVSIQDVRGYYSASSTGNLTIQLVDLMGFNNSTQSSIFQLCTNYCIELMEKLSLKGIKDQLDVAIMEELNIPSFPYDDNSVLITIIDGFFDRIDEIDNDTIKNILDDIDSDNQKVHVSFDKNIFQVKHFNGNVNYNVANLIENNNYVNDDLSDFLIQNIGGEYYSMIIGSENESSSPSLSSRYRDEFKSILENLDYSCNHFVKCIKGNHLNEANQWSGDYVLKQLQNFNIFTCVHAKKYNYPLSKTHDDFWKHYWGISGISISNIDNDKSKCEVVINALKKNSMIESDDIIMGNTLVFMKELTHDKLAKIISKRTLKATIFTQATIRMIICARKAALIIQAKDRLADLIEKGKLRNSCNISVLPSLKELVRYCYEDLKMNENSLEMAQQLIFRLEEVQTYVDKMNTLINNAKNNSDEDIVAKYESLLDTLHMATSADIRVIQIQEILKIVEDLKDRAQLVVTLRLAIKHGDDDLLNVCLNEIHMLSQKFGEFCQKDEEDGLRCLQILLKDNTLSDKCLDIIQTVRNTQEIQSSISPLKKTTKNLDEEYNAAYNKVLVLLLPYKQEPPQSLFMIEFIKVFDSIVALRSSNSNHLWSKLLDNSIRLRECITSVETISISASDSLKKRCENLIKIAKGEIFNISKSLEENYVFPELDRLTLQFGEIECSSIIYMEDLKKSLSTFKNTGCIWGYEINTVVSRLNLLVLIFEAEQAFQWDDILLLTEGPSDTKARRARRAKLQERFQDDENSLILNSLFSPNLKPPQTCVTLKSFKQVLSQLRNSNLRAMGQKIELQLARLRESAVNRYALSLLKFAIAVGKVGGKNGEITADRVKVDSIEAVMAELYLLSLTDTNDALFDEVKVVRDLVEILCVVRGHVLKSEWQKLVDFYQVACLRVLDKDFSSSSDLVLSCIADIKDEIGWIILASRNIVAYNALMVSVKSNMLTGTVGNVCTDHINTSSIEDSLQTCEKLQESEYSGISSKLEKLITFAGSLMNCRNAFVSYSNPSDRESYTTHLYETDSSFVDCKEIIDEVLLMYVDTVYCQCKIMYENILPEFLSQYFVADDTISILDEGFDISNPSNVLLAHKLKLSPIIEDPSLLIALLEKSIIFKNEAVSKLIPPVFRLEINLCQKIFDFILLIKEFKWSEAIDVVNTIVHEDLEEESIKQVDDLATCAEYEFLHFDPIVNNLNNAVMKMNEFKIIFACIDALYGQKKYEIEAVIDELKSERKSEPGEIIYRSMIKVYELRQAAHGEHWEEVESLLQSINQLKIGSGLTAIVHEEIKIIDANCKSRKSEKLLINALLSEVLVEEEEVINISKIKVTKLDEALTFASCCPNDLKSAVVVKLQAVAECTLRLRSGLLEKPLTATPSLLEECQLKVIALQSHLNISASIYAKAHKSPRNSIDGLIGKRGNILYTPEKATKMINYVPIINILLKEIEMIKKYLRVCEYHEEVTTLLKSGGVYEGYSINEINVDIIDATSIHNAIKNQKKMEDEGIYIPTYINDLLEIASNVTSLRNALKFKDQQSLTDLCEILEKADLSSCPEVLKKELQVAKQINDNNIIITTMMDELQRGKLAGTVGQVQAAHVSFESMIQKANACKNLNPNTKEAKALVKTAEIIAPIRQLLCANPVNWIDVFNTSEQLIKEADVLDLHESVLPELNLIKSHANDTILCKQLEEALGKGGPSGVTVEMIVDSIKMDNITSVHALSESYPSLSEKAQQLQEACEVTINLRSLLVQSQNLPNADVKEIYKVIYDEVDRGQELLTKSAWNNYSFLPFKQEINFIKNSCNTMEIQILIEEAIYNSSVIYLNRHNSTEEYLQTSESTMLSCEDLQLILDLAQSYKFQCARLDLLVTCLKSLIQMRSLLINGHWSQIKSILSDERMKSTLDKVASINTEYQWVEIEYRNHAVLIVFQSVFIYLEGADVTDVSLSENDDLARAIEIASKTNNLSGFVSNMMICSKYVLQLNEGICGHDDDKVSDAFIWFVNNVDICSNSIKVYVDKVQKYLQNVLLLTGLTKVLSKGRATGSVGHLNVSTIEKVELGAYLQQALDFNARTSEVNELTEIAEAIFLLRESLLNDDMIGVKNAIELINEKKIPDFVVDEVAMARSEIDNMLTYLALCQAIKSCNCCDMNTIDIALVNIYKRLRNSTDSHNLSPLLLPVEELEKAISIARGYGIISNETRKLFRKASLILSIHKAINNDDWGGVEELTRFADNLDAEQDTNDEVYSIFDEALCTFRIQLKLRAKVTEIVQRISEGGAKCIDGIVDISALSVDGLSTVIHETEEILMQMSAKQSSALNVDDSIVLQYILSLIESAKIIDSIRKLLKQKDYKAAGIAADDNVHSCQDIIKPELTLYITEISDIFKRSDLIYLLREYINTADASSLRKAIDSAKDFLSTRRSELGFILIIDKADNAYTSIMESYASLKKALSLYDSSKIKQIVKAATSLNINGPVLNAANEHLQNIVEFEALATDMKNSHSGVLLYKAIYDLAVSLGLDKHPIALRSKLILSFDKCCVPSVIIAESMENGSKDMAASETMKWKKQYLNLEKSSRLYSLYKYPNLRDASSYASRMSIESKELRDSMLLHTEICIPTSLTKQTPTIAALLVWIFGNIIMGIEGNLYSNPEVLLRNLIKLSQAYPIIRDEIYLQIFKQLTSNNYDDKCHRLWRILVVCLQHFPPSRGFENYMESYLLYDASFKFKDNADACIFLMHSSIYRYGYDSIIKSTGHDESHILFLIREALSSNTLLKTFILRASALSTNVLNENPMTLRGTKANWKERFTMMIQGSKKDRNINVINKKDFEEIMTEGSMDKIDTEVLLYLITGAVPSHSARISIENHAHKYIYFYDNDIDKKSSDDRVLWLLQNIHVPDFNPEQPLRELSTIFWEFVIEKFNHSFNLDDGLTFAVYRDIILAGQLFAITNNNNINNNSNSNIEKKIIPT